ncbi:hypothetical protein [Pseudonocardia zijingensis]|jgi:hypothetical protein|uniref:Integral membrane protein n=1 Tax=Pseudonocardia zijingensis TaxID=153376 RepID=A0ABP3ZS98_9PSEU
MRTDPDHTPVVNRLPRRGTDRVEDAVAWILTAAALLLVVAATVTGLGTYGRAAERAELQRTTTSQVRAVLLEDANATIVDVGGPMPARVAARWLDRNGHEHTGSVVVRQTLPAGAEIDVWIDAAGALTSRPTTTANAVVGGIAAAFGVLCAGGTLLVAVWLAVRRATGSVNARRWEREWAHVEPLWRRTTL